MSKVISWTAALGLIGAPNLAIAQTAMPDGAIIAADARSGLTGISAEIGHTDALGRFVDGAIDIRQLNEILRNSGGGKTLLTDYSIRLLDNLEHSDKSAFTKTQTDGFRLELAIRLNDLHEILKTRGGVSDARLAYLKSVASLAGEGLAEEDIARMTISAEATARSLAAMGLNEDSRVAAARSIEGDLRPNPLKVSGSLQSENVPSESIARTAMPPQPVPNHQIPLRPWEKIARILLPSFLIMLPAALFAHGIRLLPDITPFVDHIWEATGISALLGFATFMLAAASQYLTPPQWVESGDSSRAKHLLEKFGIIPGMLFLLLAAIGEELAFRLGLFGYGLRLMEMNLAFHPMIAFPIAAFASSYITSLAHGYRDIGQIAVNSLWFAGLYFLTGNIVWPVLAHFFYNFILFLMFKSTVDDRSNP